MSFLIIFALIINLAPDLFHSMMCLKIFFPAFPPLLSHLPTSVERPELFVNTIKEGLSCSKTIVISLTGQVTIAKNISKLFFHAMSTNCSLHIPLFSVAACGGVFNFSTGIITSPAYSYSDYPSDIYCLYNITVADNKVILLKYV